MIPVIDIGPNGDDRAAGIVIAHACHTVGFFQVVGHGVPTATIERAYAAASWLHGLSPKEKAALRHPHPFRGLTDFVSDGDGVNQQFQVCHVESPEHAAAQGIDPRYADYFQTNMWPDDEEFVAAFWEYADATLAVGKRLMSLFALALDLPADHFAADLERDVSCFAMNRYVGGPGPDGGNALVEHADSGMVTILHQRGDYEGLQVRMIDDELLRVPVRDDAFVINVGLLMTRWTNGHFRATPHSVVTPPAEGVSRMSLVTFHLPAIDAVVAPLHTLVGADGPRFEPITPYEWERQFLAANYGIDA